MQRTHSLPSADRFQRPGFDPIQAERIPAKVRRGWRLAFARIGHYRSAMIVRILSGALAIGLAMLATGCTSQEMVDAARRPGKYRFYSCDELTTRGLLIVQRERELREQIEKARQSQGGEFIIAVAYQAEYNQTLGDLQELEITGTEKKCKLRHRPMSDQVVR
jgi:hypothetical protein